MNALPVEVSVAVVRYLAPADAVRWLVAALEYGHVALATALRLHSSVYPLAHWTSRTVNCAASHGCLRAMATLLSPGSRSVPYEKLREYIGAIQRRQLPVSVLHDAIELCGDDAHVQWLVTRCRPPTDPFTTLELVATHKRMALFQWLADHYASMGVRVLAPLADGVDYVCCVVMRPLGDDALRVRVLFADAANGLAPVVHYNLYYDLEPPLYAAMDHAADVGDLKLLQKLQEDKRVAWPCTTRAMDAAATNGRLDIVQWLHANRQEGCSQTAMDGAALHGHFEVVKWLYYFRQEKGSEYGYYNAAFNGHLRVLKWQRTRFTDFNVSSLTLGQVAERGHLETLQWLDETHAPVEVTVGMVHDAVNGGHLELLQWLVGKLRVEGKNPRSFLQSHFISRGAGRGNLALLQYLWLEFAVLPHNALHHALVSGCMPVVYWIMEVQPHEEQRLRADTLWRVAAEGKWFVLEWLLQTQPQLWGNCDFVEVELLARVGKSLEATVWLCRYTRLMLHYAPSKCLAEPLLPEWAARHLQDDMVVQLLTMGHPNAISKRVLHLLLLLSASPAASRVIEAIVIEHPDWISARVVQWAAMYGYTGLLTTLLRVYSAHAVAVLRSALFTGCRHDLTVVVEWVGRHSRHDETAIDLWRGAAVIAAQHDAADVLRWLVERNPSQEPLPMLISTAVQHGSTRVFKWLQQRTPTVSQPMQIDDLNVKKAISRNCVDFVAWLQAQQARDNILVSQSTTQHQIDRLMVQWTMTPHCPGVDGRAN